MNGQRPEGSLTELQARRQQIKRELVRVERQIAQAARQIHDTRTRIARLTVSQRTAA
jgi:chromosome segregation ATPase